MLTNQQKEIDFLNQALTNASVGIWHLDIANNKFYINDSFANLFKLCKSNLIRIDHRKWFEVKGPLMQEFINLITNQADENGNKEFKLSHSFLTKNDETIIVYINGKCTKLESNGAVSQVTGILSDTTATRDSQTNLEYRLQIEKMVSGISSEFISTQHKTLDKTINQSLKKIGQFCKIDRSYLFLFKQNCTVMNNTHEWCAEGISSELENLQNIPCSLLPWWMDRLLNRKHIYIYNTDELPSEAAAEKEILQNQHILSLLVVPMYHREKLLGFIGFDSVRHHKAWSFSDIRLLFTVANTFSHAIVAKQNNDLLVEAKEKAEETNRVKSAFLATINHELRTPLHHILGFSDLIQRMNLDKNQIELYASKIYESGKNLLQIVEDIINLSTGNPAEVKVREEVVSGIDMFVQHKTYMSELLASTNRESDIQLKLHPSPDFLNEKFKVDSSKVNQILVNLFKNAIKFTHRGTIDYSISLSDNQLQFSLTDNGIGISEQNRTIIFDYFRQGEESSTRRFQGIGIGLSICKNLVQILHGTIVLESEPNKGSTFTVSLPVTTPAIQSHKMDFAPVFPIPDFSKFRVLIVDNDINSSLMLKNLLSTTGANILTTGNDMEALAYMGESCFLDIVLVDIHTSPEESFELIRKLTNRCGKCSIIGLTAHPLLSEREKALEAGCIELLSKPIEPQLLFEAIHRGIKRKQNGLTRAHL